MERIYLYIDRENIQSMVQSKDKDLFNECVRLIRKNIDVHYNFSKADISKDPYMQLWFGSVMGQGVGNQHNYSDTEEAVLPTRPISSRDFAPDGQVDIFGIYLLKDKEACMEIAEHNCVLIGNVGKELSVIQQLLNIDDEDEEFLRNVKWDSYCPKLPLTDIVMVDNFYFSTLADYKRNNNELLRVLSSVPRKYPINVVIITRNDDISKDINISEELENIRDLVQDASESGDSAVTIVGAAKDFIHDRAIITNYYRINCFGGIQKQKNVKMDIRVEIKSHTRGKNYTVSWDLIENTYQKAINKAIFCRGDKRSNYFDFK